MQIYNSAFIKTGVRCVYALGCFDGVHTAHRKVIEEAVRIARLLRVCSGVWCFEEPPKNAFLKSPVPLICTKEEKAKLISKLSVDVLICPKFENDIMNIEAEEFVRNILCDNAGAVHIVTGKNYTFGKGGAGNTELLCKLCEKYGIGMTVIDDVFLGEEKISSSAVRDAVISGDIKKAEALLGRSITLCVKEQTDGAFVVSDRVVCPPDGNYRLSLSGDIEAENTDVIIKNRTVKKL